MAACPLRRPAPAPETGSDGHLIGVDVGGTKLAVATLEDEALSSPTVQATDATSADGLVDEIVAVVEAAATRGRRPWASACRPWSTS